MQKIQRAIDENLITSDASKGVLLFLGQGVFFAPLISLMLDSKPFRSTGASPLSPCPACIDSVSSATAISR